MIWLDVGDEDVVVKVCTSMLGHRSSSSDLNIAVCGNKIAVIFAFATKWFNNFLF